ncbi:MAG: signal peptide peptidase SppA [Robiginitomaculum sp.]|nr:signal peptide peptidase SppA [Robiginitomaculum sp.]
MRQFFVSFFASVIGFFVAMLLMLVLFVMLIGAMVSSASKKGGVAGKEIVLSLDLRRGMLDHSGGSNIFGNKPNSVVTTVRALHRAKNDKKVKGLFIRANGWAMAPAQAEEIRLAIKDFQDGGKFVVAHAQGFEGTSLSAYMAVSAADEIWLQDTTGFALAGMRAEIEFLGGVFEKLDAKPEFVKFAEYKNAANTFTEKALTEPHREAMTSLLQSLMDSSVKNIAADRDITETAFLNFLDNAPHSAEKAKQLGYVDKLGHYADAKDYAKKKAGGKSASFQSLAEYGAGFNTGPLIAFVGGQGAVVQGGSDDGSNPFSNNISMGGDTVSEALIAASKNDKVKAIIFRIDSPGGSATASDQIWDAVIKAKDAGKPVIISMGQYAASGGYYVAAPADKIVAMPTTVTGSIGVVGGKVVLRDTLAKVGYNIEAIELGGEFSSVYSAFEPWSQSNRQAMYDSMEDIYVDFTSRVAEGRGLSIERVREIARGRVWTGTQAKEIGLVDEIGGFMKALEIAKELAEIDADTKVQIRVFPREKTDMEKLEQMFNVTAEATANLHDLQALTNSPEFKAFMRAKALTAEQQGAQMKADLPDFK